MIAFKITNQIRRLLCFSNFTIYINYSVSMSPLWLRLSHSVFMTCSLLFTNARWCSEKRGIMNGIKMKMLVSKMFWKQIEKNRRLVIFETNITKNCTRFTSCKLIVPSCRTLFSKMLYCTKYQTNNFIFNHAYMWFKSIGWVNMCRTV